jgi:hypothetical protein
MYGNVFDKHNCPTCQCKQSPWKDEQTPLDGLFCGRSPKRTMNVFLHPMIPVQFVVQVIHNLRQKL